MLALKIKSKKNAMYDLECEEIQKNFRLFFEFYGTKEPKEGDYIILHKKLLDRTSELFAQPYAFKICVDKSFDDVKNLNDTEYAIVVSGEEKVILKRIYG